MSQESEQAQEASLLAGLTWGNHALQLHRRATSNAIAYTDGIRDYKAALKAEIEAEMKNVPNDPENLTYPEMAAIATLKVVLSPSRYSKTPIK